LCFIFAVRAPHFERMNTSPRPHFPLALLTNNGRLILAATQNHPEIAARLPAGYLADTGSVLDQVTADAAGQKNARGELGNLTAAQTANLEALQHGMNRARQTARLAFRGQDVKLHEEFQIGVTGPFDLGSVLARADVILASVQTSANLAALKLKGWTDADTAALVAARQPFGPAQATREAAKGGAKDSTGRKNAEAADLYERLLTIQNAADLAWPATDAAHAGVRDEFRLHTFPPASGGASPTPPPPAPSPAKP
jgi:hypothetical protein